MHTIYAASKSDDVTWHSTQNIYTVSQKNDNDVPHYNFNANQPILIIFGRDIPE